MPEQTRDQAPNIFPVLRYRDAPGALRWLGQAFGFETTMEVPGPAGMVAHAEMRLGPGVIMLGSTKDDHAPESSGDPGAVRYGTYVSVADVDAHYERARAAGAEIVRELSDMDYGSREYSARDPEGYVWSFGTYRPSGGA